MFSCYLDEFMDHRYGPVSNFIKVVDFRVSNILFLLQIAFSPRWRLHPTPTHCISSLCNVECLFMDHRYGPVSNFIKVVDFRVSNILFLLQIAFSPRWRLHPTPTHCISSLCNVECLTLTVTNPFSEFSKFGIRKSRISD